MRASDEGIQQLRALHEALSGASGRKRRKPRTERVVVDRDAALDSSVLDALDEGDFEPEEQEDEEDQEDSAEKKKKTKLKIDKMANNSKKIGHISVTTLAQGDLVGAFITNSGRAGPKRVVDLVASSAPRTRYGVFVSQKSKGPAKGFAMR